MAYIDFKCTVWNRIKIPENINPDTVINDIKDGFGFDFENELVEYLSNTSKILSPEHNYGISTIVVYDDNDSILYRNGFEKTENTNVYHNHETSESTNISSIDWEDDVKQLVNSNPGYIKFEASEDTEEINEINDSLNINDINE